MALKIYNSLSKEIEDFKPINPDHVGLYTCGPTVYDYVTIGNWRTYTLGDILAKVLAYNGYKVRYIMNITDVGHLTGDNDGDADTGEDRMEKAKKREGKTAWDVASFYTDDFIKGYRMLNLTIPKKFCKATDHIGEQIELVEKLETSGLTYKINDGVYFDTSAYESKGYRYGELSNLDQIKAGARVEFNTEKRNPRDFALWKFSPGGEKRDMEWESPWGIGFPGWHIECSAMSMKYLGEQFDVHVGGEDLRSTHHPNEIAQSQGATGKTPFVKYWLHGAFLQVNGGKMGKSLGNAYSLSDILKKGISPLALRYFYFSANYGSPLNFTWEALGSAEKSLRKLQDSFLELGENNGEINSEYKNRFNESINDNLNMPKAISVVLEIIKDQNIPNEDKRLMLLDFDKVLGFGLNELKKGAVPEEITKLVSEREIARQEKDFIKSDELRGKINGMGYEVKDTAEGPSVHKI